MTRSVRMVAVLLAAVLAACSPSPLAAPEAVGEPGATLPEASPPSTGPDGSVTVAYPDEPSTFLGVVGEEVATDDLAALWGLPLLRLDPAGQLRRGLVRDWEVRTEGSGSWVVRLDLLPGTWSDGSTVDAADVVATLGRHLSGGAPGFDVIQQVRPTPDGDVELVFAAPYAAWADLLVEAGSMLPSEQVEAGLDGYVDGVPVSGGWFRLVEREPGLRMVFEAHPDGPLGAPALQRVEVLVSPSFEVALGLLEDGEADVALGHLPLNGVARAEEVDGVSATSPLGGTVVSLEFRAGGALGGDALAARRRGVAETVDVAELVEGLLGSNGAPVTSPWPLVDAAGEPPLGEVREGQSFALLFPAGSEVLGFSARAVQRDLVSRGMTVDLVGEPAPRYAEVRGEEGDVALVVRRTPRRPSLARWADTEVARTAGAAPVDAADARRGLAAVADLARTAPLFRVGVLHAWTDVQGLRPSAWVGAGFWNVGEWSVEGDS